MFRKLAEASGKKRNRNLPRLLLGALVPAAWLCCAEFAFSGGLDGIAVLTRWGVTAAIMWMLNALSLSRKQNHLAGLGWLLLALGFGVLLLLSRLSMQIGSLLVPVTFYALLLRMESILGSGRALVQRWITRLMMAATAGVFLVLTAQMDAHFAEEEIYSALQVVVLGVYYLILSLGWQSLVVNSPPLRVEKRSHYVLWAVLGASWLVMAAIATQQYQASFYTPDAPLYTGISPQTPFLCGEVAPSEVTYSGVDTFQTLLQQLEQRPNPGVPEFGFLSLATGEGRWLTLFHDHLLIEARAGRFTAPAQSVKWTQYQAAQRVYYFMQVRAAHPALFTPDDEIILDAWFKAINQRAMTAEWVDWLYAFALAKQPEGPYENQENGAGLLALLEVSGLADETLSGANQAYLSRLDRGWSARFRNTDDAYAYQMEWLENAYFQSLYSGYEGDAHRALSYAWMLLQALPDGAPLVYNDPYAITPASTAYMGATLLQDPHLLWWAGQSLAYNAQHQGFYPRPKPGIDGPMDLVGTAPASGSCLLYGDSGLPNQSGGLAPDKIVFRDGWLPESRYLLLNLRFTGWHRYKATNTVSLLYQGGPLLQDLNEGRDFTWMPEGRSVVRDKRLPRENMNGLLIERTGISRIVAMLSGVGGAWAQDPPHYAEILSFDTNAARDYSHTRLVGWHGWTHDRWVDFRHNGEPVLIVDQASGPVSEKAVLVWHPVEAIMAGEQRILLREGELPVEMRVLATGGMVNAPPVTDGDILYEPGSGGQLQALTLILFGERTGAQTERRPAQLRVYTDNRSVVFDLPDEFEAEE